MSFITCFTEAVKASTLFSYSRHLQGSYQQKEPGIRSLAFSTAARKGQFRANEHDLRR